MSKRVYISADYDPYGGDKEVVEELNKWGQDDLHKVDFVDMSKVASGSVSNEPDCRICDLKQNSILRLMLLQQSCLLSEIRPQLVLLDVLVSELVENRTIVTVLRIRQTVVDGNNVR